jgi:hypothetical protein
MKRLTLTIAALVWIAAPSALAGPSAQDPDAQACKAQRNTIGMSAFRLLYAPNGNPKAAMEACLAQQQQVVTTEAKNAAKACKAERGTTQESRSAFEDTYGQNGNKKNAFGKCVSQKAGEAVEAEQEATLDAAKACKAERGTTAQSRETFTEKYGGKKNAFGKCVSQKAKTKTG